MVIPFPSDLQLLPEFFRTAHRKLIPSLVETGLRGRTAEGLRYAPETQQTPVNIGLARRYGQNAPWPGERSPGKATGRGLIRWRVKRAGQTRWKRNPCLKICPAEDVNPGSPAQPGV